MTFPIVLLDDAGIRPAGKSDECFYCHQKVGTEHKKDCVILQKKVKMKYTFEVEIEVPWFWNKNQIEFHFNGSSWCADNALNTLEELSKTLGCLCSIFNAKVINNPRSIPYRKIIKMK